MPLRLPDKLPAIELLKRENIFVMDNSRAISQDIRPLKIVILNLMPFENNHRNRSCPSAFQYSIAVGYQFYEVT